MTLQEFRELYSNHPKTTQLVNFLQDDGAKVHLKGLVGSATSLVASGMLDQQNGTFLFVLDDKEEAAYFMNDLESINPDLKPLFFPKSHRVAYQTEKTENANVSMRAEVLNQIRKDKKRTVVVTFPEALAENVVTKKHLSENTFEVKVGETIDVDFLDEMLIEYEFEKVDYVFEPGQFSVRGGIIDVFSYSFDHPYRIELFDDEVESIRKFDPVSQLSVAKMKKATIVPNVGEKLLEESHESFFNFIPNDTIVWLHDFNLAQNHFEKELEKAEKLFEKLESPLNHLPPEEMYSSGEAFENAMRRLRLVEFSTRNKFAEAHRIEFDMNPQPSFNKNFDLLSKNLQNNQKAGYLNIVVASQPKQIERLYQIFEDKDKEVNFKPIVVDLNEGFIDKERQVLCYTDHQIFDRYHRFKLKEGFKKNKAALTIKELSSLQPGDYVVHIDHGIGEFSGLQKIDVNGKEQEAIRLTYKGGDILYVSIHSLHRISKYSGKEGTVPKIHKLGTNTWQKTKNKTKNKVKEMAFDLLKLYAKRKAQKGTAFSPDTYLQTELEASFMYEDTPDQLTATQQTKKDMESESPMDRLICGDVGFGKTEIAIRAAFKAVADNKQVAVLVPTTILSLQHYHNFTERLKDFPCNVDYINRFKKGKKLTETIKKLESGETDIIVGTHALVGKRVKFKDLGLLVIDEEQKFGVSVKDKLKTLRENVDTLTLTATPIPRTLQFSLMGARDLSVISTPPPNRYPVHTELATFNEETIRDAVSYEISRGGQVYFVHNRVGNIKEVAGMIQRLVPDARVGIGHGQMDGDQLEDVMTKFIDGVYDVLVATTIIESGIDISNANTMIINEAQNFGLSDLHQLRGRVGRSNKKAFCYLLAPPIISMTAEARRRLQAVEQFSDLGSGMNIAMRDLDIRGAGNLLGGEQSGFINDLGFETYQKILAEAVDELKREKFQEMQREEEIESQNFVSDTVLETDFEVLIPDEYVGSIAERIALYRELDNTQDEKQLEKFQEELIDRFGPMPQQVERLLDTIKMRWIANEIGFEKIIIKSEKLIGYFVSDQESPYYQSPKFARVIEFIKQNPRLGKMYEKNGGLRMSFANVESIEESLEILKKMVNIRVPEAS
ncbi:transcription-repair coupling factor [Halocola ammonii]